MPHACFCSYIHAKDYVLRYDEIPILVILFLRREALQKWKQKLGTKATYNNLIKVFEQAGYETYAEFVKGLVKNMQTIINQTPPPPSEQPLPQLPVFPAESKQFSESPSYYAAAPRVKLLQEDYELGTKEAVNIIIP